ncbi:MAG: hypothetical protein GY696_32030, partial [Gammaproteobacteria bacterium]|nr:hypothetical protein [Gammaproteobacteria bacterium]
SETTTKKKAATIDKLADKLGAIERKTAAELDKMKERMLGQNRKFEGITHSTNLRLDGITGESTENKIKSDLRSPTGKSKDFAEGTCFLCHESGHVARSCPTRRPGDTKDRSFMRNLRQSLAQMELSEDEDDASRLGETDEEIMQLEVIEQGYQTQRAVEAEMFPRPKFGYESFHADPVTGKSHLSNLNSVFLDSDISTDESELEEEPRLIQPSKVKPYKRSKHLVTKQNAEMVLHAEASSDEDFGEEISETKENEWVRELFEKLNQEALLDPVHLIRRDRTLRELGEMGEASQSVVLALIDGLPVTVLFDSGSEVDCIPWRIYERIRRHNDVNAKFTNEENRNRIVGFAGMESKPLGEVEVILSIKGHDMPVTCTVVEKATVDMIIRFETLTKLGWIINGIEGCIVGP